MRLIPVIDILNGVVVRGIAGKRDEYRPLQSAITNSIDPCEVAGAIRRQYSFEQIYVADLDAITRGQRNFGLYRRLCQIVPHVWIDAGVVHSKMAKELLTTGAERLIVGSESCPSPAALQEIVTAVPADRVTFSLDLKHGQSLAEASWGAVPLEIAQSAFQAGVRSLIVLDLAAVGTEAGVQTLDLCRTLRHQHGYGIEIITGGGVRSRMDIEQLEANGVDAVLIASALHSQGSWLSKSIP